MSTPTMSGSVRSTPARAIPSTLVAKTSPSIPPPTHTYEPLVKTILRHRLTYNIFLQSALVTWAIVIAQAIFQQTLRSLGFGGLFFLPIRISIVICSGLIWAFVALPVIVIRRFLLTPTRTPATSPANSLSNALSKPFTSRVYAVTSISALAMLFFHVVLSCSHESTDPKLGLFVKSRKHPRYLNGRLLFLVISQVALGISYVTRNIMLDRYVYQWSLAGQKQHPGTNFNAFYVIKSIVVSIFLSLLALPLGAVGFATARAILPILYKIPFLSSFLKPFTAHFLRGSWTVFLPLRNLDIIQRSLYLGTVTCLIWEAADTLFELNTTKHIAVSHLTVDPNETSIAGISSTDLSFKYFAYCELKGVAEDESKKGIAQRMALFMDQKHNPTLWSRLVRESLIWLGRDYQNFMKRGKTQPSPPPTTGTAAATTSTTSSLGSTVKTGEEALMKEVPLLRKRIFKRSGEEDDTLDLALDTFGSDGPITKVVDSSVKAMDLPEIFRSTETKILSSTLKHINSSSGNGITSITGGMVGNANVNANAKKQGVKSRIWIWIWIRVKGYVFVPGVLRELGERVEVWWRKDRANKVVEGSLAFRELDVIIVEVISRLVCASLTEDKYGVVQKDIPRILEAFLSYLEEVEKYQIEINSSLIEINRPTTTPTTANPPHTTSTSTSTQPTTTTTSSTTAATNGLGFEGIEIRGDDWKKERERERVQFEVEKAGEVLGEVADGLKEGIARIVRTFGDKLLAFKFPPRTAKKLQGFLDYC